MVAMEVFTVEAFHQLTFMSKLILFEHFQQRIMSSDNHIFHDLTECEIEQTITKAIETTEKKVKYFICLYIIVDNFCFHTNFSFFLRLVVQKQIDWRERTRYHLKFYSCIITYLHGFSSISNFQHFVPL